ncbi:unnamed protein product, partial [Timema podura]|nr:unnamed protein product [Timema podura]
MISVALLITVIIWILDANTTGILNMTPAQREVYEKERLAAVELEREKLLASGSMSDITPHDLLQPHSDFHIRNRYLSRIGANLCLRLLGTPSIMFKLALPDIRRRTTTKYLHFHVT